MWLSFRSFLYNFTLDNWNHVLSHDKSGKNCTLNFFQNNYVFFDFTFFLFQFWQIQCPALYYYSSFVAWIPLPKYQYLLLSLKWSVHSIPILFAYFLIFGYFLWAPDNSNSQYLDFFKSYREWLKFYEIVEPFYFKTRFFTFPIKMKIILIAAKIKSSMYRMQVKLYGMLNIYIMDVNKKKTSDLSLKCFYTVYKNKTITSKPKQISLV